MANCTRLSRDKHLNLHGDELAKVAQVAFRDEPENEDEADAILNTAKAELRKLKGLPPEGSYTEE